MSCWVVPSIAAELWGVAVDQVMNGISAGQIPSKIESGFTFVDVAPDSPKLQTPRSLRNTPATFTVVTPQEEAMLCGYEPACEEYEQYLAEDDDTIDLSEWRLRRDQTAATRRRPIAA
jgi:hypothetical protein